MIPIEKVHELIAKHDNLEKELSSGEVKSKFFSKKSKEYASLGDIILFARRYVSFEKEKKDLEQIIDDKNNDIEIVEMAKKDLEELKIKKKGLRE